MKVNRLEEIDQSSDTAKQISISSYRPMGDEREQLEIELRDLAGELLSHCMDSGCLVDLTPLCALSQQLDETNAKLKMHIRNLKTRETASLERTIRVSSC